MNLRYYTWAEFDAAVDSLAKPIAESLFPIPRGGLILAIALSHKFDLPIVKVPNKLTVFVDDIVDSGKTLRKYRMEYLNAPAVALLKRSTCLDKGVAYAEEVTNDDWIVFPWENKDRAKEDYEQYLSRQ